MENFEGFGLHSVLQQSLKFMKYTIPTPIQAEAIPPALSGRDILGSAQTGTGKTAAFAIPLVEALLNDERAGAIVLTPTRELGKQVMEIMRQLIGPKSSINTAFLIGGDPYSKQNQQLRRRPRLVVGTPGRINDHLERGNLHLDQTRFLVLDEMDRMLDMGFSVQIDRIVKYLPNERQTLMFSATMPNNIMKMADKYLHNPKRIAIGSTVNIADNIDQKIVRVDDQSKKYDVLVNELEERSGTILVFVKTKRGADKLAKRLRFEDHKVDAIHGDLKQNKRERVIKAYRNKQFRILIATDVVARGLDVPHIAHVINYDMPQVPEDYIHRIGRTARAGASGEALCMISPQDGRKWHAIEQMLYPEKFAGTKPANDQRKDKGGKFRGRGRGKPYAGGRDRNEQGASGGYKGKRKFSHSSRPDGAQGEQRSGGYKGKRDYSDNRSSEGNRSASGGYKGKRNFSDNKQGAQGEQGEQRRSYNKPKRDYSENRSSEGNRNASGGYKGKRDYSDNRSSEGKRSASGGYKGKRKFTNARSNEGENSSMPQRKVAGGKPMHKKQTTRSRNYAEDGNAWSQTSRGGNAEGKKSNGGYKGKSNGNGGNSAGGNKGRHKISSNRSTFKQDGDQPRRGRSSAGNTGGYKGNKTGGYKGNKQGGYKGNRAA